MNKLTKAQKIKIIKAIKEKSKWSGCMCDECLLMVAKAVLDEQLKNE